MSGIKRVFSKIASRIGDAVGGNGLMQEQTSASGERYVTEGISGIIRGLGAESCVLLKNENGVLPVTQDRRIAVFGRCQLDWFYVGYGSGGDVNVPYHINLMEGLENCGADVCRGLADAYRKWCAANPPDEGWWGHWPMSYPEMPLEEELIKTAAKDADTAVIVLGRAAGEDRENTLTEGSYYLTRDEEKMLSSVCGAFEKVAVLLNTGNIIDMSWTLKYGDRISAVMLVWQGGMESGNSVADVLCGRVSPSGRLPDTIAAKYEDYPSADNFGGKEFNEYKEDIFTGYRYFDTFSPEKVLFPFGFGLSYTRFEKEAVSFSCENGIIRAEIKITNTGDFRGKEACLLFCRQEQQGLKKAARILCGFAKTKELAPGESQSLTIECDYKTVASYDESAHAFVLDEGCYAFETDGLTVGSFTTDEKITVEQCGKIVLGTDELRGIILGNLPDEIQCKRGNHKLSDVTDGKIGVGDFIAELSDEELEALTRGHGMMNSSLGTEGNAGAFGGIIPSLREKGVPPVITTDGPAGIRLKKYCALLPCGTALASGFNTELTEKLYGLVSREMTHYGTDILLAPGMNIHRNPLCGRNFEYFSEDPLLSGKMAAAVIRGIQSYGHGACPKHFACNNQETKRNVNDSRVSERALREIYLRNFEIAVKEGKPLTVMTSYNKVNGVWSHYNYILATLVLRNEWGFDGTVITDWWMQSSASPEFPKLRDNAYRVRAQVDVLMPGDMKHIAKKYRLCGHLRDTLGKEGGITRAELQRSAENVLKTVIKLKEAGGKQEQ